MKWRGSKLSGCSTDPEFVAFHATRSGFAAGKECSWHTKCFSYRGTTERHARSAFLLLKYPTAKAITIPVTPASAGRCLVVRLSLATPVNTAKLDKERRALAATRRPIVCSP